MPHKRLYKVASTFCKLIIEISAYYGMQGNCHQPSARSYRSFPGIELCSPRFGDIEELELWTSLARLPLLTSITKATKCCNNVWWKEPDAFWPLIACRALGVGAESTSSTKILQLPVIKIAYLAKIGIKKDSTSRITTLTFVTLLNLQLDTFYIGPNLEVVLLRRLEYILGYWLVPFGLLFPFFDYWRFYCTYVAILRLIWYAWYLKKYIRMWLLLRLIMIRMVLKRNIL